MSARPVLVALVLVGALGLVASSARVVSSGDPATPAALLRIAGAFNAQYSANHVGAVYERFDAQSQAVISRSEYVTRHRLCPDQPGTATMLGAQHVGGFWVVGYEIDGVILHDYWHYVLGRWEFDLVRSNPGAVRLYRMAMPAYEAAVGCTPRT